MENKNFLLKTLLTALAIFGLIVTGCATRVFDDTVPLEQSSRIYVNKVGAITGYNGIDVNWSRNGSTLIPAGDTLLEFNVNGEIRSDTILRVNGALFRYNFQPGKVYDFFIRERNGRIGLNVYSWNFGEPITTYDGHFVEFVPFLNLSSSREPTVLN
jgi:hypothetical protein